MPFENKKGEKKEISGVIEPKYIIFAVSTTIGGIHPPIWGWRTNKYQEE